MDRFGRLLRVATGGRQLPTLSARGTDTLARHADLLLQIRDGHRPLVQLAATTDGIPVAVLGRCWPETAAAAAPTAPSPPS